jgi:hypothetical protein
MSADDMKRQINNFKKLYLLICLFISSAEMKRNYGQTVSVHSGSATRAPVDVEKPTGEDRPNADDGARDRPDPRAENDSLGTDGDEVRFSLTGQYGGFLEVWVGWGLRSYYIFNQWSCS